MSETAAPSPAQTLFADVGPELASTRRVLERVPDAHWGFRPHPRSWTLGELASHLANMPTWGATTLTTPELDMARVEAGARNAERPASRDAVLALFDRGAAEFQAALGRATPEALAECWEVRRDDEVAFAAPRAAMLRGMVVSHMVHHRAQLGVYLRLLDVPVPSVYGPTADEGPAAR